MLAGPKANCTAPSQDRLLILSRHLAIQASSSSPYSNRINRGPSPWWKDEQRERPQTRVNAATVVLPFPVDPKVEDQGFSGDLLDLIDVTPPYLRLADFGVHNGSAWALVDRESDNPYEVSTPMTHAEMCRHAAIVGELACAVANPSKRRHFYLATKSEFILSGMQGLGSDIGAQIELEAKVSRLDKGLAATKIQVYIPGPVRQLYAEMKLTYLVLPEQSFLQQLERPSCGQRLLNVMQATQNALVPSPYVNPIMLSDIETFTQDSCSAQLHFTDVRMTAGHFPDVPALPAAIVGANAIHLISLGFPAADSRPARITVLRHVMKFRKLPMLGDSLDITLTKKAVEDGCSQVFARVSDKATKKDVMTIDLLVAMA